VAVFFVVQVEIPHQGDRAQYDEYIRRVKPIVESYGGRYLIRSEEVYPFGGEWSPDRIIVIQFESRSALDRCFASPEYRGVKLLRETSVIARAVVVEQRLEKM